MILPTGTVTFLRTDVEGSMRLARALGRDWDAVNGRHLDLIRAAVEANDGTVVRTEGDAAFAVFPEAHAGVMAAVAAQRALATETWPPGASVRVRMGLHTGEAHLAGDDYGGFDVSRAARVAAVGHGGQIVLSGPTHALVSTSLPAGLRLRDLGRHALRDVPAPEHLFQVDVPGRPDDFPPLRVAGPVEGNLPERVTSFVGRDGDLAELARLGAGTRLITLTGPGGIGKTSLAVEFARASAPAVPDGAWFVPLEAVTDADQVGSVIARTLGLFDGSERPAVEALPGFMAARSMVLVLDNFEHVLDAAGLIATLVRASPGTRFVVTSRAPLHLSGEQEYPVRPLPTGVDDPSVALFVERGRAVRPDWDPARDRSAIAEICGLLDGLPLGIELAAARLSILPVHAIRDRLAARLPLPGSGPRDAPARQQTLDGTIAWSHDLLAPDERAVLHDLAVFEGGFDLVQAERVVATDGVADASLVLDRLVALADQALIARAAPPTDDSEHLEAAGIRFTMLKTVQTYALARLREEGRETDVRRRHALAYVDLAETAAVHLNTSRQPPWIDRLGADIDNLRAAIRWSVAAGETEIALRLVGALWRFWLVDGRLNEGAELTAAAFAMPGAEAPTLARSRALAAAGGIAYWQGDREATARWYSEQLDVATLVDDRPGIADAWFNLAAASFMVGDVSRALECQEAARRAFEDVGDERGLNRTDWGRATLLIWTQGFDATEDMLERLLARAEALDDAPYVGLAAGSLAWGSYARGDRAAASRWGLRAILTMYGLRDVASTSVSLALAALIALDRGRPDAAATLLGAFGGLCDRYGVRPPLALSRLIDAADPLEQTRAVVGTEAFEVARQRGRRMTLDEAIELLVSLGDEPAAAAPSLRDPRESAHRPISPSGIHSLSTSRRDDGVDAGERPATGRDDGGRHERTTCQRTQLGTPAADPGCGDPGQGSRPPARDVGGRSASRGPPAAEDRSRARRLACASPRGRRTGDTRGTDRPRRLTASISSTGPVTSRIRCRGPSRRTTRRSTP